MPRLKTVVMVPKGAEFKAVRQGLQSYLSKPQATKFLSLVSLPVGPTPVRRFLTQWSLTDLKTENSEGIHVIVMGLCGSLSSTLNVGDAVIYQHCLDGQSTSLGSDYTCSLDIPIASANRLISTVTPVTGITCDRVLVSVSEKQQVGKTYAAEVVDMEGIAVIQNLEKQVKKISILRVVSDDAEHNLPDLSQAFDENGNVRAWVMARQFLRQPNAALRLILGSLKGLKVLRQLAQDLGSGIDSFDASTH